MSKCKMYVTNTETVYRQDGIYVDLHGRNEDGFARSVRVEGFEPYFFVREEVAKNINPENYDDIAYVDPFVDEESFKGVPLGKVVPTYPHAMYQLQDVFDETWEADVEFTDRFLIDEEVVTGVEFEQRYRDTPATPEVIEPIEMHEEERRLTFDIEVDDSHGFPEKGEQRILCIVAHDNYTGNVVGFFDTNGEPLEDKLENDVIEQELPEGLDQLQFQPTEKGMLKAFCAWIQKKDPDMLVGWNSKGFDIPYLVDRMENIGVDPDRLCRGDGEVRWDRDGPQISGRAHLDLMDAWASTKYTEPDRKTLDHAASVELDDAKLDYDEGSVMELYNENPAKLLEYNVKDVLLTHRVGEEAVYDFKRRLRDIIGVDWEDTIENKGFTVMLVRRKLHERGERGPTATPPPEDGGDYEGAYTLDPHNGVAEGVVEIDLSSLYPMTMWMTNASPETKVSEEEALRRKDGVSRTPNGVYYDLEEDGLFKEVIDDSLELKATYKTQVTEAEPGSEEEEEAEEAYVVAKQIVNSIYGVNGWARFFLYDEEVAESITLMSQEVTRLTENFINHETNAEVIYGDTDSCYICFGGDISQERALERAEGIIHTLNETEFPELAREFWMGNVDCRWEMELEKYCSYFFQANRKKRYAYLKTWREGMQYDETIDEFGVTGFECVRSDTAQVTEDLQLKVLEAIVRGEGESEIGEYVYEAAQKIQEKPQDWEYIGIPGGIGKPLDEYESPTAQVKGAKNANKYLGKNIQEGDKPYRCYLNDSLVSDETEMEKIEVICYDRNHEVQGERLEVNVARMRRVTVKKPMQRILDAVDINTSAAMKGQLQQGLGAFM